MGLSIFKPILDFIFPRMCLICRESTLEANALCPECWKKLHFIQAPLCVTCGNPIPSQTLNLSCPSCLIDPPPYTRARSIVAYHDSIKPLILRLKHGDAQHLIHFMARLMQHHAKDLVEAADVIVPVPLHWRRLFARSYNQAALLAQRIALDTGKSYDPLLLQRTRATVSQGRMRRIDRVLNVKDAFIVNPGVDLANKTVLLIDDVQTTGATINACAQTLKEGGAAAVHVLTLARVLKSHYSGRYNRS